MVKSLGSLAVATGFIALLIACSPLLGAEFRVRLMDGSSPAVDAFVAPEVSGPSDSSAWVRTDDRGDVITWAHSSNSLFGPSRVVFAYAEDSGLSVLIEGQDFEWRRNGNSTGREWLANFEADLAPVNESDLRTCGADRTITFEVEDVLPGTTWMSVGTGESDGIRGLDCSVDNTAVTCPCPDTITDRSFLVSRHAGSSSDVEVWDGVITVDIIVELQLAE
ncbi:MAG: hypothetical protein ACJATT_004789 [Myxococcota bacterium]|jgi:hypothetical protein